MDSFTFDRFCNNAECRRYLDLDSDDFVVCGKCEDTAYCSDDCMQRGRVDHNRKCTGNTLQVLVYKEIGILYDWSQYTIQNSKKAIAAFIKRFKSSQCCICHSEKPPEQIFYARIEGENFIESTEIKFNWIAYSCSSRGCSTEVMELLNTKRERTRSNISTTFKLCSNCWTMERHVETCPKCYQVFYCSTKCRKTHQTRHKTYCSMPLSLL